MILFMKGNQINQCQLPHSTLPTDPSSFTCPLLLSLPQDQGPIHGEFHLLQRQEEEEEEVNDPLLIGGPENYPVLDQKQSQQEPNDLLSIGGSSNYTLLEQTSNGRGSVKWMSSKMRLMKKKMDADKHQIIVTKQRRPPSPEDQTQLRVCSNCNTTKTPLWRSGPQGPKSLCNACGIRRMKARRAMRLEVDRTVPFKKGFKMITTSSGRSAQKKLLRIDEVTINKLGFSQAFPHEERDAAILLMALSCGLIHG